MTAETTTRQATDSAVVAVDNATNDAALLERVVIVGDLSKLQPEHRVVYYREVCRSLGLNPLTRPFQYIVLNGSLTLYATRTATDQLRAIHRIGIDSVEHAEVGDLYIATVHGHARDGRSDTEVGAVNVANLRGDARANAIMKAITKAKRRLTLSLAGLGWLDDSEVGSLPGADPVDVDPETGEVRKPQPSLSDVVAARRAAMSAPTTNGHEASSPAEDVGPAPEAEPPLPPEPLAGARTVSPVSPEPEAGNPTPAPTRCEGFSPEHGKCVRDANHPGNHASKAKETWS